MLALADIFHLLISPLNSEKQNILLISVTLDTFHLLMSPLNLEPLNNSCISVTCETSIKFRSQFSPSCPTASSMSSIRCSRSRAVTLRLYHSGVRFSRGESLNIWITSVSLDTFHWLMSPLNLELLNILCISVTLDTSHLLMSPLNSDTLNMHDILVTLDTFHLLMSPLN